MRHRLCPRLLLRVGAPGKDRFGTPNQRFNGLDPGILLLYRVHPWVHIELDLGFRHAHVPEIEPMQEALSSPSTSSIRRILLHFDGVYHSLLACFCALIGVVPEGPENSNLRPPGKDPHEDA